MIRASHILYSRGRKIGSIRLQQHSIQRDGGYGSLQLLTLLRTYTEELARQAEVAVREVSPPLLNLL
jgi:hypothetical protein